MFSLAIFIASSSETGNKFIGNAGSLKVENSFGISLKTLKNLFLDIAKSPSNLTLIDLAPASLAFDWRTFDANPAPLATFSFSNLVTLFILFSDSFAYLSTL